MFMVTRGHLITIKISPGEATGGKGGKGMEGSCLRSRQALPMQRSLQ